MTTLDVSFRFTVRPDEATLGAVNSIREVYGIRRIILREAARTVTVEYDATRLNQAAVTKLLRGAGLDAAPLPPPHIATPKPEEAAAPAK